VTSEDVCARSRLKIPDADRVVVGPTDDSVARKLQTHDTVTVPTERVRIALSRLHIVSFENFIFIFARQYLPVSCNNVLFCVQTLVWLALFNTRQRGENHIFIIIISYKGSCSVDSTRRQSPAAILTPVPDVLLAHAQPNLVVFCQLFPGLAHLCCAT